MHLQTDEAIPETTCKTKKAVLEEVYVLCSAILKYRSCGYAPRRDLTYEELKKWEADRATPDTPPRRPPPPPPGVCVCVLQHLFLFQYVIFATVDVWNMAMYGTMTGKDTKESEEELKGIFVRYPSPSPLPSPSPSPGVCALHIYLNIISICFYLNMLFLL